MKVKIKELAKAQGMSLYKLALEMQVPCQTVYAWANGRNQPSYYHMDMLCDFLQCELTEIFQPTRPYHGDEGPEDQYRISRAKAELDAIERRKTQLEAEISGLSKNEKQLMLDLEVDA